MTRAALPNNEERRVAELRRLDILDTPPEERFDRLTRLAQRLFDVPIALVSLVESDRQWFKSKQGLDAGETTREVSFCAHAILGDDVLMVTDARQDPRFADNPLVHDNPSIRFYAGCPIESPSGHKLGTLCVIDRRPRELDEEEVETLRDLAGMVERELAAIRMATTDPLTGLSNRRGFHLVAGQLLAVAQRIGTSACLAFIDLDGLKQINDELGHEAGDHAIVDAASILNSTFRESDVLARLSGDEFCVLFTASSGLDSKTATERLTRKLEAHNEKVTRPYRLSLSFGYADFDPAAPVPLDELLKQADAAMYRQKQAKKAG